MSMLAGNDNYNTQEEDEKNLARWNSDSPFWAAMMAERKANSHLINKEVDDSHVAMEISDMIIRHGKPAIIEALKHPRAALTQFIAPQPATRGMTASFVHYLTDELNHLNTGEKNYGILDDYIIEDYPPMSDDEIGDLTPDAQEINGELEYDNYLALPEQAPDELLEPVKKVEPIFNTETPKDVFKVIPVTTQSQIENEVMPVFRLDNNIPQGKSKAGDKPKTPTCPYQSALDPKICPFPLCSYGQEGNAVVKCVVGMRPGICMVTPQEPVIDTKAKDEPYIDAGTALVPIKRKPPAKISYEQEYVSTKLRDLHVHVGDVSPNANGDVIVTININLGDM
jgi:hypothetical protein